MKRLFVGLAGSSFVLAILSLAGIVAQAVDPNLINTSLDTAAAWSTLAFLLTWACAVVAAIGYGLIAPHQKPSGERSMYCISCSYMLVGLPKGRCPECGRPFDPENVRTFRRFLNVERKSLVVLACCWLVVAGLVIAYSLAGVLGFITPGVF